MDHKDFAFVRSITGFCRDLGIMTIAESIEDGLVYDKAKLAGIDFGQGVYILRSLIRCSAH